MAGAEGHVVDSRILTDSRTPVLGRSPVDSQSPFDGKSVAGNRSGAMRSGSIGANGHPPWRASLDLAYGCRNGRTVPLVRRHLGPLRILKGHAQSTHDCWEQIIVHPPGGIAARDSLRIAIGAQAGTRVLFTTPGATKWYRTPDASLADLPASQVCRIQVDDEAGVEWLPMENILFNGCNASIDTRFVLAPRAALMTAELVCLGRPASRAPFERGRLQMRTEVTRASRPLFIERIRFAAGDRVLHAPAGLAGHACFGSLIAVPASRAADHPSPDGSSRDAHDAMDADHALALAGEARRALAPENLVRQNAGPASTRSGHRGELAVTAVGPVVLVRWRGASAQDGWAALRDAWALLRPAVIGRPAQPPRIWAC